MPAIPFCICGNDYAKEATCTVDRYLSPFSLVLSVKFTLQIPAVKESTDPLAEMMSLEFIHAVKLVIVTLLLNFFQFSLISDDSCCVYRCRRFTPISRWLIRASEEPCYLIRWHWSPSNLYSCIRLAFIWAISQVPWHYVAGHLSSGWKGTFVYMRSFREFMDEYELIATVADTRCMAGHVVRSTRSGRISDDTSLQGKTVTLFYLFTYLFCTLSTTWSTTQIKN